MKQTGQKKVFGQSYCPVRISVKQRAQWRQIQLLHHNQRPPCSFRVKSPFFPPTEGSGVAGLGRRGRGGEEGLMLRSSAEWRNRKKEFKAAAAACKRVCSMTWNRNSTTETKTFSPKGNFHGSDFQSFCYTEYLDDIMVCELFPVSPSGVLWALMYRSEQDTEDFPHQTEKTVSLQTWPQRKGALWCRNKGIFPRLLLNTIISCLQLH